MLSNLQSLPPSLRWDMPVGCAAWLLGIQGSCMRCTPPAAGQQGIHLLVPLTSKQICAYRSLGANDFQVFMNVTLPSIRWGLLYGLILTNAVSRVQWRGVGTKRGSLEMGVPAHILMASCAACVPCRSPRVAAEAVV